MPIPANATGCGVQECSATTAAESVRSTTPETDLQMDSQRHGSQRQITCLKGCPAVLAPVFAKSPGQTCTSCGVLRRTRARVWNCPTCPETVCPDCRKRGHRGAPSTQQVDQLIASVAGPPQHAAAAATAAATAAAPATGSVPNDAKPWTGPANCHSAGFIGQLLSRLRQLPAVAPLNTHMFVPKSLVRRYAKLATQIIEWLVVTSSVELTCMTQITPCAHRCS
jgi:hypothetical protein